MTPDGSKVYVANSGSPDLSPPDPTSDNVSVIDTATNTVTATVTVGTVGIGPIPVALTPDGSKVYVANTNSLSFAPPFLRGHRIGDRDWEAGSVNDRLPPS